MVCCAPTDRVTVDNYLQEHDLKLYMRNSTLECVSNYPYLGFQLDHSLLFVDNLSHLCKKANHKGYLLSKIRHFLSAEAALIVYKSHVLSILEYGAVFCLPAVNSKLEKLQKIQNRLLRVCFRANRLTSNFELHSRANLLPLDYRRNICMF